MAGTNLQLTLEAIDRASGPMRKVERAIDALETAATGAAAPLGAMDKALDKIDRATRPLARTGKALEDIERAAEGAVAPINGVDRALYKVGRSTGALDAVERAIEGIEHAAHGAAAPIDAMERALDEVGRSGAPLSAVERQIEGIQRAAGSAVAPIERMERAMERAGAARGSDGRFLPRGGAMGTGQLGRVPGSHMGVGAVAGASVLAPGALSVAGTGFAGAKVISQAADFETALTEIQKKAGLSAQQTAALGEEMKGLATSGDLAVPISEIAAAYERGAAAGISTDKLGAFAAQSVKGADAFGMSAENVGNFVAKLQTGLGMTEKQIAEVLDLTNSLADAGIADESSLVGYMDRAGATLKTLGLTKEQTLSLGATMLNLGMAEEVAATGSSALAGKLLTVGTLSGKNRKVFEKYMGSVKGFSGLVEKDANGALLTMLDRLNGLNKADRMEFLSAFVGTEWADEMLRLVEASGEYRRNLELAADPTKWMGSLDKSYALKLGNFWSQWQLAKNDAEMLAIDLGTIAMPGLKAGLGEARGIVQEIRKNIETFPSLINQEELNKALTAVGDLKTGVSDLLGLETSGSAIGQFFGDLARFTNETAKGINEVKAFVEFVRTPWKLEGAFAGPEVMGPPMPPPPDRETAIGRFQGGSVADRAIGAVEQAVGALNAVRDQHVGELPKSEAVPELTTLGTSAVRLANVFAWWSGLVPGDAARATENAMTAPAAGESSGMLTIIDKLSGVADAIRSAIVPEAGASELPADMVGGKGARVVPDVAPPDIVGPLAAEGDAATMTALDIGRRIEEAASVTATPTIDVSSIVGARAQVDALAAALRSVSAQTRALPSPGGASAAIPIDGARAGGGPVGAGGLYLVGEKGPELFSPGRSGMIHTADDTSRLLGSEPRTRPDLYSSAAASALGSGEGSSGGTTTIDASVHVGAVSFASPEDKADFEALLRRHSKTVADVVAGETRRESRRTF